MTYKYFKDGCVAVLVSHGYGAGWSSWGGGPYREEELLFDPGLAKLLEEADKEESLLGEKDNTAALVAYAKEKWPEMYLGGLEGLRVHWVPVGTRFRIHEYDGSESIDYLEDFGGFVA